MTLRKKLGRGGLGQSVTELALVLPIILFLVYGVFELGRVVFIFSSLNNATREAARYGAAAGLSESGAPSYLDCAAIRRAARESAFLAGLSDSDIQIAYDQPMTTTGSMFVYGYCGSTDRDRVQQGDRVLITVSKTVEPILPILPSGGFSLSFATARTILKDIVVGPVECSDDLDNDGDGFTDWDGDGGSPDSGCSSPDDTTEAFCYTLNVISTPAEAGNLGIQPDPNCANRYIEQTTVHLTASAAERYIFKRWSGSINSTANPVSFVMDSDKDVVAEFRLRTSDLEVVKNGSPNPVGSGKTLSYEIFVTNLYTETARNVVITDTLPAGVQLEGWSINVGNCPEATDATVRCEIPELPMGSMATLTINVLAPTANYSPLEITNTVEASAFEFDPNLANNRASVTTLVMPRAELTADSKVDSVDPVNADSEFDYTITVGNSGPSIATGVAVTDTLPGGMTFVSSADACAAVNNQNSVVRCDVGELGVGATATVAFRVKAPRNTPANTNRETFTNEAIVAGNETESDPDNNSVSETTDVVRRADLGLTKSAPPSAYRDVAFDYVLTVSNAGPSDALDVQIVDSLPSGVRYNSFSSNKADATCSHTAGTVTCNMGMIADGETFRVYLDVTPTISEGTLTNSATVSSSTDDSHDSNDSDSTTTTVTTDVALAISKTDSADPVREGDPFAYTIRVDNNGASNATGVEMVDYLPEGVDFVSVDAPGAWNCSATDAPDRAGTDVTCTPADGILLGGQGATITINVTAADAGTFSNYARIRAAEDELGTEEPTTIEPRLDLSLDLSAPETADVDVSFNYGISVANSGPSDATNVRVVTLIPSSAPINNVTITSGSGWFCSFENGADGGQVLCTALTMAAGDEASFSITVTPYLAVDISSEANVTADESAYDSNRVNDSDSALTLIDDSTTTTEPSD